MKKHIVIVLAIVTSFCFGFALNGILISAKKETSKIKKVTGIGGIFFKCKDPKKMREWYQNHLGFNTNEYGSVFEWRQGADSTKKDLHNGVHFPQPQSILSLQQKIS